MSVIEKTRVKLSLQLKMQFKDTGGHTCNVCSREMNEKDRKVMNDMVALEVYVHPDLMLALVYTAGYIPMYKKTALESEYKLNYFYADDYRNDMYLKSLYRDGLTYLTDSKVQ